MLRGFLKHSKIHILEGYILYKYFWKGGGGGGVRKENGGKKIEIRKYLDDFWSTPESVFCKAILWGNWLYIDVYNLCI